VVLMGFYCFRIIKNSKPRCPFSGIWVFFGPKMYAVKVQVPPFLVKFCEASF